MEKGKSIAPPPARGEDRDDDEPKPPQPFLYIKEHPGPPRTRTTAILAPSSPSKKNKKPTQEEESAQKKMRPSAPPGKVDDYPFAWWPKPAEWRLAVANARWRDEMEKKGAPYDTKHLGMDEVEKWRKYFDLMGYDPEEGVQRSYGDDDDDLSDSDLP